MTKPRHTAYAASHASSPGRISCGQRSRWRPPPAPFCAGGGGRGARGQRDRPGRVRASGALRGAVAAKSRRHGQCELRGGHRRGRGHRHAGQRGRRPRAQKRDSRRDRQADPLRDQYPHASRPRVRQCGVQARQSEFCRTLQAGARPRPRADRYLAINKTMLGDDAFEGIEVIRQRLRWRPA